MSCTITLTDIDYGCDNIGVGGIVELHVADKANALTVFDNLDADARTAAATSIAAVTGLVHVEFNVKDGFSVFSEVKTNSADGISSTVPTISVEVPLMNAGNITAINQMSKAGAELVAFVKTAAGTYHIAGLDYGLYVSSVDGNSGTGRSEKNRYQLTLTGEENGLSYSVTEGDFNTATA